MITSSPTVRGIAGLIGCCLCLLLVAPLAEGADYFLHPAAAIPREQWGTTRDHDLFWSFPVSQRVDYFKIQRRWLGAVTAGGAELWEPWLAIYFNDACITHTDSAGSQRLACKTPPAFSPARMYEHRMKSCYVSNSIEYCSSELSTPGGWTYERQIMECVRITAPCTVKTMAFASGDLVCTVNADRKGTEVQYLIRGRAK